MNPLWSLSATDLVAGYSKAAFTPVDVLESCQARLKQVNPTLNAVIHTALSQASDAARQSAARWARGEPRSGIDGVPLTVKDNIHVAGMPTTWGSALFQNDVPARDETPVAVLRQAGAVVLGKTNVPEFTLQGYTDNLIFGATRNPWDLALTPGGSSGGAVAAVAAGIGPVALGTDGGGSIRRPASHTGLVGLKPSLGRVSRGHGLPSILHEYEVIGPIARTVADVERIMQVIGVADAEDPRSSRYASQPFEPQPPIAPCKILYLPSFSTHPVDKHIQASVDQAVARLAALGHHVCRREHATIADPLNESVWPVIVGTALAWLLRDQKGWEQRIDPTLVDTAHQGMRLTAAQYLDALDKISQLRRAMMQLFGQYDLVITPSAAALPWAVHEVYPHVIDGHEVGPRGHAIFTAFVNVTGLPALNLPAAPAPNGLPIGFQIIGPEGSDARLCSLGRAYEAAHPWRDRWPPLA